MKCILLLHSLKKKISLAERFTGKNITLPILSNILFCVKNQILHIRATNLEIACDLVLHCKEEKDGIVAVQANSLSSYIQSLPSENKIILEEKEGSLIIKTETAQSKVLLAQSSDFPLIPKIESKNFFTFSVSEFKNALKNVISAVSTTQLKPELNGIFISFNVEENSLVCVATDTFRLAEKKIKLNKIKSNSFSFILPLRFSQELIRFETDEEGGECVYGEAQVLFRFGEDELISNIVQGKFPHYQSIIPKKFDTHIEIDSQKIIEAIKSTSFFSSKLQDVCIRCEEKNVIIIHSENSEIGETTVSLEAITEGKSFQISFNYKFFLDGISALSGGKAKIFLNNESSPVLVRDGNDPSFIYLIMPIKAV
ncbi:MAG: DNA polymerase III subunit beta [Patescibacteria group bacterium]